MVVVPHRLLGLPTVEVLHAGPDVTVLRKRVREPLHERPSYLARHALSFVTEGEQVVYDAAGSRIRIRPGAAGLMRRDLYTITDLLAGDAGAFATTVVFFSDAVVRRAAAASQVSAPNPLASAPALQLLAPTSAPRLPHAEAGEAAWVDAVAKLVAALVPAPAELLSRPRRPLREFMRAHYDKPLSVEDYAYLTGRSVRSFRRDFAARFGVSPKKWLVERRMERARELLTRGDVDSVGAVAEAIGYASASHFIERYRARFGETPGVALAAVG